MELVWSIEFKESNFVHYHCECKPFIYNNKLFYAFSSIDINNRTIKGICGEKITILEVNLVDKTTSIKYISFKDKEPKNKKILLTNSWHFIKLADKVYLYIGFLLDISKQIITISNSDYNYEEFSVKNEYEFGDKYLTYNQRSTIECFYKTTYEKIWKAKFKGFIYTNIELKNNCLLFGTAGRGGAFYCIELETGKIITEHINGGSSNYEWQKNSIILKDKKGNIQQINPFTGEILKTLILKDKLFYAPILVDKQYIYTTVYNKKFNSGQLICLQN